MKTPEEVQRDASRQKMVENGDSLFRDAIQTALSRPRKSVEVEDFEFPLERPDGSKVIIVVSLAASEVR